MNGILFDNDLNKEFQRLLKEDDDFANKLCWDHGKKNKWNYYYTILGEDNTQYQCIEHGWVMALQLRRKPGATYALYGDVGNRTAYVFINVKSVDDAMRFLKETANGNG